MTTNPAVALPPPGSLQGLLARGLLLSAAIFVLLEVWRPCFFLTDDNLSGGLPVLTEMGHHLVRGESPFVTDWLFGGHYPMLEDPVFFLWHPFYLAAALLAVTPVHFWILEVVAFAFLMLATSGFLCLGAYVRRQQVLPLSDGWLLFYALSYTYTFMAVTTGSSWLSFLGNHSAMPWLALGILQTSWRRGLALVTGFSIHHLLGGHFAPFISITLFLSLFTLGVAWWRRSWVPLISWGVGNVLTLLIVLPLLLPAFHGFAGSDRGQGLTLDMINHDSIPLIVAPASYFLGTSFWMVRHAPDMHVYAAALAACAAAWCIIPAFAGRFPWHFLELLCLGLMAGIIVLVIRPEIVTRIMMHVPLLRSLRWPFRELLVFHFFLHLFLVLRRPAWSNRVRWAWAGWSAAVFVLPMLAYAPPSLNPLKQERQLLFSGQLDAFWAQVREHLKADDRIAVIIPPDIYEAAFERVCYGLLGSHNFCCLFHVINASGYSPTAPEQLLYVKTRPAYYFGAFGPWQIDALWNERPGLKLMVLKSLHPIRIVLRAQGQPDIDLTPYVPKDVNYL